MCGVTLKDKVSSVEVGERMGVESIEVWLKEQCHRVRIFSAHNDKSLEMV